jgi:hypothetical protein
LRHQYTSQLSALANKSLLVGADAVKSVNESYENPVRNTRRNERIHVRVSVHQELEFLSLLKNIENDPPPLQEDLHSEKIDG